MPTLLRLKDGTKVKQVPSDWQDVINMVGASLVTSDRDTIARLKDAPFKIGDCIIDAWQGIYWTLRQSHLLGEVPSNKHRYNGMAIVVGSGPSLDLYIDKLRSWQGKALIVCAHSTLNKLLRHDIVPNICTPVERLNYCIPGVKRPGFIEQIPTKGCIYGGLPVVPNEHLRYEKRMLTCSNDHIYAWLGCKDAQMFTGSFSGSAAAAVAKSIATGPVYMVGMDLTGDHYAGYEYLPDPLIDAVEVLCVDGKLRDTTPMRHRVSKELTGILRGKTAYQCAPHGICIEGVEYAELPDPVDTSSELVCVGEKNHNRVEVINGIKLRLVEQLEVSVHKCYSVDNIKDMNCDTLFDKDFVGLGAYLFRSLFAQMSIESRFGMPQDAVLEWTKEAYRNAIEGIIGGADALRYS